MRESIIKYLKIIGISFGIQILGIILFGLGVYIGDNIWPGMYDGIIFSIVGITPFISYIAAVVAGIVLVVKRFTSVKARILCIIGNPINYALPGFIYYILTHFFIGGLW